MNLPCHFMVIFDDKKYIRDIKNKDIYVTPAGNSEMDFTAHRLMQLL